ncbi:MAG: DUF6763 family protein [Steroidobacteraceae bacterium]|jgi:hypothetical protein
MNTRSNAIPGQWYLDRQRGDIFQVVGVDGDGRSIDIQYADGSVEDISLDDWVMLDVVGCDQPEDWVGPYDDLESDDIGIPENTQDAHSAELPMERALLEIEEQRSRDMNEGEG